LTMQRPTPMCPPRPTPAAAAEASPSPPHSENERCVSGLPTTSRGGKLLKSGPCNCAFAHRIADLVRVCCSPPSWACLPLVWLARQVFLNFSNWLYNHQKNWVSCFSVLLVHSHLMLSPC
jgi:hypothetical protein